MSESEGQTETPAAGSVSVSPLAGEASSASLAAPSLMRWRHRLLRRVFHLWFRLSRGMTMGVRALVLDDAGRVFLVRHTYLPGWHLPGGGIEAGQNAREALEMELAEEAHIRLTGEPELHGIFQNREAAPRDHVVVFVVRAFVQDKPRLPDREIAEAGFFPLDALPGGTTAATRRRLDEVMQARRPPPSW